MTKHLARHAILSETPTFDADENLRIVVETPKGSQAKYAYDPECDCFTLKTVMPAGMTFPYDFGFVPSTLGEDGDPIDALVLMDFPVVAGCVITARPIGIIEAEQKKKGGEWSRNDRLIAVASHTRAHSGVHSLKDLRPRLVEEIIAFFEDYNRLHHKKFRAIKNGGGKTAEKLIEKGRARFEKKRKKKSAR